MKNSYRSIAKGSAIFGGTQIYNILIGIIRGKLVAMILTAAMVFSLTACGGNEAAGDAATGEADALQHQCTICRHQAAHIWDPDQVSPNGHVCSCGYAGAHTFSTDAPTDTDTCDICHETWAAINGW